MNVRERLEAWLFPLGAHAPAVPTDGEAVRVRRRRALAKVAAIVACLALCTAAAVAYADPPRQTPTGHWQVTGIVQNADDPLKPSVAFEWVQTAGPEGEMAVPDGVQMDAGQRESFRSTHKITLKFDTYGEGYTNVKVSWQPVVDGVQAIDDGVRAEGGGTLDPGGELERLPTADLSVRIVEGVEGDDLIYWECKKGERTGDTKVRTAPSFLADPGSAIAFLLYGIMDTATGGMCDVANDVYGYLVSGSVAGFNRQLGEGVAGMWDMVLKISDIVKVVTIGLLGVSFVVDMMRFGKEVVDKHHGYDMVGSYVWMAGKYVIAAEVIAHSHQLMGAIFSIFVQINGAVADIVGTGASQPLASVVEAMRDTVTFGTLGYAFIFLIIALVGMGVMVGTAFYVLGLCVTRLVEAHIMTAFAGIPIAMMTERTTKPGAIHYFKNFAAIGLQLSIVMAVLSMSGVISTLATQFTTASSPSTSIGTVVLNAIPTLAATTTILALVRQSRTIAQQIIGT